MAKTEKMFTIEENQFGKIGSCLKNESVGKALSISQFFIIDYFLFDFRIRKTTMVCQRSLGNRRKLVEKKQTSNCFVFIKKASKIIIKTFLNFQFKTFTKLFS